MKNVLAILAALAVAVPSIACEPIGWRLVDQKSISISERLCVYEKNGARISILVDGFCPFSPC